MENILSEAFQRLSLLENDFDFSTVDANKVDELKSFVDDDVEEVRDEEIFDINASTEDELEDTYVGKVILECACCHSKFYKEPEEVIINDELGVANETESCPICHSDLGYKVIGKIEKFDKDFEEPEEEAKEDDIPADDIEETDESLKSVEKASDDSKTLDEAKLPLADRIARKHIDSLLTDVEEGVQCNEILDDAEKARMAEITKSGVVKADDREEYNELRKKEKEVAEDTCPECGENPCVCDDLAEAKELDEVRYDSTFDKMFDDALDELEKQDKAKKAAETEPDPWGEKKVEEALTLKREWWGQVDEDPFEFAKEFNLGCRKLKSRRDETLYEFSGRQADFDAAMEAGYFQDFDDLADYDESLGESVEVHADNESDVDVVKNDDGSVSVNVGAEARADAEEIVPLTDEEEAQIAANEPEGEESIEAPDELEEPEEQIEEPEEAQESLEAPKAPSLLESITDADENKLNSIFESYLKRVYSNVASFSTSNVQVGQDQIIIEGIINFESGKTKTTSFNFANPVMTKRGKIMVEGFNKSLAKSDKAFTMKFTLDATQLIAESMVYNYSVNQINESNNQEVIRVRGRVKA